MPKISNVSLEFRKNDVINLIILNIFSFIIATLILIFVKLLLHCYSLFIFFLSILFLYLSLTNYLVIKKNMTKGGLEERNLYPKVFSDCYYTQSLE